MSRMDTLRFLANFYPRSPCGERLGKSGSTVSDTLFLSTLSLRRATLQDAYTDGKNLFLSTLSLRRATAVIWFIQLRQSNFYPRSPCGERLPTLHNILKLFAISIHALLAESDQAANGLADTPPEISIHALLAESDVGGFGYGFGTGQDFYPRSPCGERPPATSMEISAIRISIHALLAESDFHQFQILLPACIFLSTLSLRRATKCTLAQKSLRRYFYPRSPCGERRPRPVSNRQSADFYPRSPCGERQAVVRFVQLSQSDFYPRSPCGERPEGVLLGATIKIISIHALLAESDAGSHWRAVLPPDFYPRSPCGERRLPHNHPHGRSHISIHALLAESDAFPTIIRMGEAIFLSTLSLRRATRWFRLRRRCR